MIPSSLGDGARLFSLQRQNADLRTRLGTLERELATGEAADMARHLGGDLAPLADLDRRLSLSKAFGASAREAGNRLATMQVALGRAEAARAGLAEDLMEPRPAGAGPAQGAADARAAFADAVSALNTRMGEAPLFAGTAAGGPALASADAMLAAVRAAAAGATTAAGVAAALDAWFDDPAGGFATAGYLGTGADAERPLGEGETVALRMRADDPAPRGLLKAAALAALADDPALLPGEGDALLVRSRDALLSLAAPMVEAGAALGRAEARVEAAQARHAAEATAWGIMRVEATQADPFATASAIEAVRVRLETHYELTSRMASLSLVNFLR